MNELIENQINTLNQLYKESDDIYREVAAHSGLSDAAFWILYALCASDKPRTQHDLCSEWFYPKQTINSACSSLMRLGYVFLAPIEGTRNKKAVKLTDTGKEFCQQKVFPVLKAEQNSFLKMSESERKSFLNMFQKQLSCLRETLSEDGLLPQKNFKGEKIT